MKNLLANAFSFNMMGAFPATVMVRELSLEEARALAAEFNSVVGHTDTAAVFSDVLGMDVACNRTTVILNKGDRLLIGQLRGPRLPEGCKTLPDGATIQWLMVTIE